MTSPTIINEEEAKAFLIARFGSEIGEVQPVARQGDWSRAFGFSRLGREYIIRFSALLGAFEKDRLASRFLSVDLPIPKVTEIDEAFGGYYAISEKAPGVFIDDLGEAGLRKVLPALFVALDAARTADLSGTRGFGGWETNEVGPYSSWREALLDIVTDSPPKMIHGWREKLAASPWGIGPFDEAFKRLLELIPYLPEERYLVHSDLLHYNVLVEDARLGAIIDWGCSMYCDFLWDVAWIDFWSQWYPAWRGIDFQAEILRHYEAIGLGVPHFVERLYCYKIAIGLDGLAYNAFRGSWNEIELITERTLAIAHLRL